MQQKPSNTSLSLFPEHQETRTSNETSDRRKMREPFGRIDGDDSLRNKLLPHCRLREGEVWRDPKSDHIVGCIDATSQSETLNAVERENPRLCVADPPYNVVVGAKNTKKPGSDRYFFVRPFYRKMAFLNFANA